MMTPPARHCHVVAKFVLLEDVRREQKHANLDELRLRTRCRQGAAGGSPIWTKASRSGAVARLSRPLSAGAGREQREFVIDYYRDEGHQKIERRRDPPGIRSRQCRYPRLPYPQHAGSLREACRTQR